MNKVFIPIFISAYLFIQTFLYAILALFGMNDGQYNSLIYIIMSSIAIIIVFIQLVDQKSLKLKTLLGIAFCLVIILHYSITVQKKNPSLNINYFIMWGLITLLLMGTVKRDSIIASVKYIEIVNLIQSVAAMIVTITFFTSGNRIVNNLSFGGETYNTISYVSSTSVGLFLFFLYFCNNELRFKLFNKPFCRLLYWGLIVLSVITTFLSGGRGGAVLIILYIVIFIWHFNRLSSGLSKKIFVNIVLIGIGICFVYMATTNNALQSSLSRTFSYISRTGFDFSQTSYREQVYSSALSSIKERLFLGYGPLNYPDGIYPHNYFLELLLSGGIVYLIIGSTVLIKAFRRAVVSFRYNDERLMMAFIFLSTIIMLMFSGSFYLNVRFWATITYFLCIFKEKY